MKNEIKDKVVVITGASSGIGEVIALSLAKLNVKLGHAGKINFRH